MKWRVLIALVLVSVPLYYFGYGAYDLYNYRVGTATTAKDIHCRTHRPGIRGGGMFRSLEPRKCTGTWSLDARSHTGKIEGPREGFLTNSSAEVRVNGDTAYTAEGATWRFVGGVIAAGLIALFTLWIRWIARARRRYRDRSRLP